VAEELVMTLFLFLFSLVELLDYDLLIDDMFCNVYEFFGERLFIIELVLSYPKVFTWLDVLFRLL